MKALNLLFIITTIVSLLPYNSSEIVRTHVPLANIDPFIASLELDLSDLNEIDSPRSDLSLSVSNIQTVIDLTQLGLGLVKGIRNLFDEKFNGSAFNHLVFDGVGEEELLSMFHAISHRLNDIQAGVTGTQVGLRQLVSSLPHLVRWEVALSSISEYALPINSLYHKFNFYQIHREEIEDHTLSDFATSVVTHDSGSIQALMANIHSMIAPDDPPILEQKLTEYEREEYTVTAERRVNAEFSSKLRKATLLKKGNSSMKMASIGNIYFRPSIFTLLLDSLEGADVCHMEQSPQGMVFGFYTLLVLTQGRAYTMIKFAHLLLRYYKEGDFTAEQQLSDELYNHYSKALQQQVINALARASTMYRKCDPKVHKEGKTYEMVKELLQGYVENEVDLNARGTCTKQCSDYTHVDVQGCFMPETQYCGKHRRCKGTVHECSFLSSDAFVCISEDKHRRYDWIRYENMEVLGNERACANIMVVHSWWRFLYHCSYCVCYCDDPSSRFTERYISLTPTVSDVANNKIVTGIRFIKKNKVIHIQIKEGKTQPQGQINRKSERWVDVEPISVDRSEYVAGTDYTVLRYEARHIDLDTLKAPRGHVITGFKFHMLGSHLNLEMWVTPISFTNGTMTPRQSYWISNSNTAAMLHGARKEIILENPQDPRFDIIENEIRSTNDTFIKFKPTSLYSDVGQLTVPFFDAQEVSPNPPVWLQGIDMYFRGTGNSGGFLGFSVYSYNLTSHFEDKVF